MTFRLPAFDVVAMDHEFVNAAFAEGRAPCQLCGRRRPCAECFACRLATPDLNRQPTTMDLNRNSYGNHLLGWSYAGDAIAGGMVTIVGPTYLANATAAAQTWSVQSFVMTPGTVGGSPRR